MPSRFVYPSTDTLTLDNGDTLIVRRRLNMGEHRASVHACYVVALDATGAPVSVYDPTRMPGAKVAAYLVDWQMPDAPPIRDLELAERIAVVENLDVSDFFELKAAIDAHEARQITARLQEKKRAATTNAAPTSNSPSGAAGASTGSASSTSTITRSS
jgi:hypothetical protein